MRTSKIALFLVLVPCTALTSCAQQEEEAGEAMEMAMAVDMEALGAAMAEMTAKWTSAFQSGDAAGIADLYTDDAMRMAPNEDTVHGRAAIEELYNELLGGSSDREITINTTDYGAAGDIAYSIGTYVVSWAVEGEPMRDEGKYLTVSKITEAGTWKIYAHMWNSNMPLE